MNDLKKKYDLENRLIDFAVKIIEMAENLKPCKSSSHLSGQIIRSATAPALIYGEVQAAESQKDFIHKILLVLKELRETRINLLIMERASLANDPSLLDYLINESNELIAIFRKSSETAKNGLKNRNS